MTQMSSRTKKNAYASMLFTNKNSVHLQSAKQVSEASTKSMTDPSRVSIQAILQVRLPLHDLKPLNSTIQVVVILL